MKLRCDLTVNGAERRLLICQGPSEPEEHLALRLAAYLLFWDREPIMEASVKTPALSQFEFMPDVLVLNDAGEIAVWVECDTITMNKLTKLTRRVPVGQGRIIVLKTDERAAQRLRDDMNDQLDRPQRIEIFSFPGATFKEWTAAVAEKTDVYGEATENSLNAVVNDQPFSIEFARY